MDTVGSGRQREVDAVVHDEGCAGSMAALAQPLGQRQETAGWPLLLPKLGHAASAGEGAVQDRLEVPPPRRRAVEDDVERGVHQPRSRSVSTLVKRPSRNAGSFRTFRWNGIDVFTPSTTVSASARRIRPTASARSPPWTMTFASSES